MERKTARISRELGVHRQETPDTTTPVFMEKGCEAATMRDVTVTIHVVSGLCYWYFESKQVLYSTVTEQCIKDTTYPMIGLLEEMERSLDGFLDKAEQLLIRVDGKEKYHYFFHKKENHDLQMFMSIKLRETIGPYMKEKPWMMNGKGITRARNIPITVSYVLSGVVPILENDELSTAGKTSGTRITMKCVLGLQLN